MNRQSIISSSSYANALDRAYADHLVLNKKGRNDSNQHVYNVYNPFSNMTYTVTRTSITVLVCNCGAAAEGYYCKHRAFVTSALIFEADAIHKAMTADLPYYVAGANVEMNKVCERSHRRLLVMAAGADEELAETLVP